MGKLEYSRDVLKDTKRTGWLVKQGHGLIKKWQERFFVLKGDKLYYFKSDPFENRNAILAGILELKGCALSRKDDFIGVTPKNKKEVYLITSKTKNMEEISMWYSDIDNIVHPPPPAPKPVKIPPGWFHDEEAENFNIVLPPVDEVPPQDYERDDTEDLTARLNLAKSCKAQTQELEAENSKLELLRDEIADARKRVAVSKDEKEDAPWRPELRFTSDVEKKYDICICYSESHSTHIVKALTEPLQKLELKITELTLQDVTDWKTMERTLASSKHAVIVINSHCLQSESMKKCIEAVMYNQRPNTMIYPIMECKLSDVSESSSLIRGFFTQKPILFLPEYLDSVVLQLKEALKTWKSDDRDAEVFLSFDAVTGQGISKRLYEVLKHKYSVRISSDWTLNAAQTEKLLNRVEKFILVLTEGYLHNKACLHQARYALRQNMQIIVVKDFLLKVPENIPTDLRFILDSCLTFKWMAEFNQYCVEKLDLVLGQESAQALESDLGRISNKPADVIARNFNANHPLSLTNNNFKIGALVRAMELYLHCKVDALRLMDNFLIDDYVQKITDDIIPCKTLTVTRSPMSTHAISSVASSCINLTRLTIKSSITDDAIKHITDHCPKLADLSLSFTEAGDFGMKYLLDRSKSIRRLKFRNCKVTDMCCKYFVDSPAKLTHLEFEVCHEVSAKSLLYLISRPRRCLKHVGFINIKLYEDHIKKFVQAYKFLESLSLENSSGSCMSFENAKYIIENMPNLKKLDVRGGSVEEKQMFEVLVSRPHLTCLVGRTNSKTEAPSGNVDNNDLKKYVKEHIKNKKLKTFLECVKQIELPQEVQEREKPKPPPAPRQSQEEKMEIFNKFQADYSAKSLQAMNAQQMDLVSKLAQWYTEESQKIFSVPIYVFRPFGSPEEPPAVQEPVEPVQTAESNVNTETPKEEAPQVVEEPNEQESIKYEISGINATPKWDFTLCYVSDTGSHAVGFLKSQFDQLKCNYQTLEIPRRRAIQPALIEEAVASSQAIVMILSEKALGVRPFAFAMEVADRNRVGVILVHDADTCFFPAYSEQPPSVVHFFSEKAVTFLSDYTDTVASQILGRVEEHKSLLHSHNESHHEISQNEDLHTRMFLSHKRSTAQHIAGRLWESFHKDYKVFLDSEAQFKIHDLERIVKETSLFVLILSGGYFNSQFCVAELSSALKNNTPIVVIQDGSFKIPDGGFGDAFDLTAAQINQVLSTSPTLTWFPEYHNQCVTKMKSTVLAGNDESFEIVKKLQQQDYVWKKALEKKVFDEESPLILTKWENFEILDDIILSLRINYKCTITHLDLSKSKINSQCYKTLLQKIPELESLNLESFQLRNTDFLGTALDLFPKLRILNLKDTNAEEKSLEKIPDKIPLLEEFHVTNISNSALAVIIQNCQHLKRIYIDSNRADDTLMQLIATYRQNVEILDIESSDVTDAGLQLITSSCKQLQSLRLEHCNITDLGLRNLVAGNLPLHTLKLYCSDLSDNALMAISAACPQLKKLTVCRATIETNGLQHLVEKCTQLEYLNLKNSNIKKEALAPLAQFTSLKSLNLSDTGVTDAAVELLQNCKFSLTKLNIVEFSKLKDQHINAITLKHPNLISLSTRGENLTEQALEFVAANCPRLQKYCCVSGKFSEDALSWLLVGCPGLTHLDLTHCDITDGFVKRLARSPLLLRKFTFRSGELSEHTMQYLSIKKPGMEVKEV